MDNARYVQRNSTLSLRVCTIYERSDSLWPIFSFQQKAASPSWTKPSSPPTLGELNQKETSFFYFFLLFCAFEFWPNSFFLVFLIFNYFFFFFLFFSFFFFFFFFLASAENDGIVTPPANRLDLATCFNCFCFRLPCLHLTLITTSDRVSISLAVICETWYSWGFFVVSATEIIFIPRRKIRVRV